MRLLRLDELAAAVRRRTVPNDLAERPSRPGARCPPASASPTTAAPCGRSGTAAAGAAGAGAGAVGAGGGIGDGPSTSTPATIAAGSVLVVATSTRGWRRSSPASAGLVAETGSPLSHLAILAREHGVPIVVGIAGATTRVPAGDAGRRRRPRRHGGLAADRAHPPSIIGASS